ncbi:MAG: cysteine--tRNA ligase [Candidatus Pacebacteria bacterium]|nr:cysteine--tRNA ligase [Candidatus Paceibacterota bacterium]
MSLVIHNTLTGTDEIFKKSKKSLKMFVCGPTVYGPPHIGHARVEITFDAFARYLREMGHRLTYIQNVTDVDDKIIVAAKAEGVSPVALARQFEKEYVAVMKTLRVTSVDRRARASAFIKEIQEQILRLLQKGYAYETENGVYFEVRKFKEYGALSKQDLDATRPHYRIEPDKLKKDPLDFALWKRTSKDDGISWKSPWGEGRPGWHIEDTAITEKLLGQQYDIHGGGLDLKFPHHESEIAQQEAASGKKPFVRAWMHVGMVLSAKGEKMSKSLKNFLLVEDFLKKNSVDALRFMFLSAHYRSPVNYSEGLVEQSRSALATINEFLGKLDFVAISGKAGAVSRAVSAETAKCEKAFAIAMDTDFNTPQAIGALFTFMNGYAKSVWGLSRAEAAALRSFLLKKLSVFGLVFKSSTAPASVRALLRKREIARVSKDFAAADAVRAEISKAGYAVEDTPIGPHLKALVN